MWPFTGHSSRICGVDLRRSRVAPPRLAPAPVGGADGDVPSRQPGSRSGHRARLVGLSPEYARPDEGAIDHRPAVLGYASVGSYRNRGSNEDLQRQTIEIASECERRGLRLLEVVRERDPSDRREVDRPGLEYALGRIAAGKARGLVVSELSRASHSLAELGRVLEWLCRGDARFVAVVPGLDSEEEAGKLAIRTIIEVSRWERQRLVERTRSGMRAAGRKGPASVAANPELRERIARMRAADMTLQAIADQLNAEGVPTIRAGAKWRPSSVQAAAGYRRPLTNHTVDLRPAETLDLPRYPTSANTEAEEA